MLLLQIVLWVSAAWLTFGALALVSQIGKPRTPPTPGVAIFTLIVTAIIVTAIVIAAVQLQ
ncbi:hypothetical protein [Microbacterium sp. NPDC089696]|uniref:hypothetical protein n=1 Tax=Microbacterium sp. NPDC089696 TaxID=3364199 RepID=UPI0037F1170C